MTRLHNAEIVSIDFSKGIDAWNLEAEQGTDKLPGVYSKSHPMHDKEVPDGFVDDILNFNFMPDGSLIQRGGIFPKNFDSGSGPDNTKNERAYIVTRKAYYDPISGHTPLIGIRNNATGVWRFMRASDTATIVGTGIVTGTTASVSAVFYNARWYIYRSDVENSFYSFLSTGATPYAVTTHSITFGGGTLATCTKALIWKDRAWLKCHNGIAYSKATDPAVFAAPDGGFFQLPTKTPIKDFIVYDDNLFMIDSANGVWQFSYSTDPGVDGYLRQIVEQTDIPVSGPGTKNDSFAVSNGELFVAGGSNVYRIVNGFVSSIADQLHIGLNLRDQVQIWDMGSYLFLSMYYFGSTTKNARHYVYSHSKRAWTRYHFQFGGHYDEDMTQRVYIETAQIYQAGYDTRLLITLNGSSISNQGTAFFPVYYLEVVEGFSGAGALDGFRDPDVWNGNTATVYREPKIGLKTGIKYFGERTRFKRMLQFTMDAYLGWRQAGDALNKSPYRTQIKFAPQTLPVKSDSALQRTPDTATQEYNYQIAINQRARGVSLSFEREDSEAYGTSFQSTFTGTDQVTARAYINRIICHIRYPRDGARRNNKSSAAYTEATTT